MLKTHRAITTLVVAAFLAAPRVAPAQAGDTVRIRVQPNLSTQPRDGFTVCIGTAPNRAFYGSKLTSATGIVTFTGIPSGTNLVATVTKSSFGGRELQWIVPAGSRPEVIITLFTGSGGPACPGATTTPPSVPPPPPPPAPSSAAITVSPGKTDLAGFYVCVGTSQNRGAYGNAITPATGTLTFPNLPGSGMIKATILKAGFTGAERDWYPTPGQAVVLSLPIARGEGLYTCPGYVAPFAKAIRAAVTLTQQAEVRRPVSILPAARVLDQYDNGLAGVSVAFTVTQGGGVVMPASATTGPDGIARPTSWRLGEAVGTNTLRATTEGVATAVVFTAMGVRIARTLEAVTATTQQGKVGTRVPESPGVVVRDGNGDPVQGAKVSFTASTGSGSVSPGVVVTGSDGIARLTSWTLGSSIGEWTVRAGMPGLVGVTFTTSIPNTTRVVTVTLPVPPAPPPRLPEEPLGVHGWAGNTNRRVKYSCNTYGTNYVLVGLRVNHLVTVLTGLDLFCAPLLRNGTLGTSIFLPATARSGGTLAQAVCPSGQAITGVQGTTVLVNGYPAYLRSLQIHCSTLLPSGLVNGSGATKQATVLGIASGSAWGPDRCTQNRPARAAQILLMTYTVDPTVQLWDFQMFCEQPTRGN